MIQAFGDKERLGEATFTIITTPSVTAVWVVVFTKWCLSVEPCILGLSQDSVLHDGFVLKQPESRVLVGIDGLSSKKFTMKIFKKIEDMNQPLWQSRSTVSNYS